MRLHLSRTAGAALAGVAVALVAAPGAPANTLTAGPLVRVPDRPLAAPGPCDRRIAASTTATSFNFPGSEVEPMVAVDPADPQRLVAAFQQDRWSDGGANGDNAVVSSDGGASWTLSTVQAAFSLCSGGLSHRASDAAIAFSSDGRTVYQAAIAFNADNSLTAGLGAVEVSTSTDHGVTWAKPKVVKLDASSKLFNDKEWITADPTDPAKAYLVWDRTDSRSANRTESDGQSESRGPTWFSETTNSGASWSTPKMIYDPGLFKQTIDNEILAPSQGPARGQLLDGFVRIAFTPVERMDIGVIRSANGGTTWSLPTIVSSIVEAQAGSLDDLLYRTADNIPQFAEDPSTGDLYVVWQDGRLSSATQPKILFSQSIDGGRTWSAPIEIDQAAPAASAFTPQVAVNSAHEIGVTYYDDENASVADPGNIDEYIVHCHAVTANCANAASWAAGGETRLSPSSFDMTTAPFGQADGYFTGDYEGLTASGLVFDAFFAMAQPIATAGPTDVFATTAQ